MQNVAILFKSIFSTYTSMWSDTKYKISGNHCQWTSKKI